MLFLYGLLLSLVDRFWHALLPSLLNWTEQSEGLGGWHVVVTLRARRSTQTPRPGPHPEETEPGWSVADPPPSPSPPPDPDIFGHTVVVPGAPPGAPPWRRSVTGSVNCPHVKSGMVYEELGREGTGQTIRWRGICSSCGSWCEGANKTTIWSLLTR
jgi:hypothetical protein